MSKIQNESTISQTTSVQRFCEKHNITEVSVVRLNKNDYPYMTFLKAEKDPETGKQIAENIYFAKSLAEKMTLKQDMLAKDVGLGSLSISIITNNASGESMPKIVGKGGTYAQVEDLF